MFTEAEEVANNLRYLTLIVRMLMCAAMALILQRENLQQMEEISPVKNP